MSKKILLTAIIASVLLFGVIGYFTLLYNPSSTETKLEPTSTSELTPTPSPSELPELPGSSSFFPLGLYCVNTRYPYTNAIIKEFPEIARAGFNLIQSYQFESDPTNPAGDTAAARKYLDAAHENGLKVLMGVAVNLQNETMDQDLAHIRERVSALKDHPALFSWKLYDEPDTHKIPPKNVERAYGIIKEIDPLHPISISVATPLDEAGSYFNSLDILLPQWLMAPLSYAFGEENKASFMKEIEALTSLNKSFMHDVYVYNVATDRLICPKGVDSDFEGCQHGYPTREEIRSMAYYAIIHGTKGINFNCYRYNYDESDPGDDISPSGNPRQWQAVSNVATELRSLEPMILAPQSQVRVTAAPDNAGVEFLLKDYQDRLYLIAVNTKDKRKIITFTFSESPAAVKVLNESRTIFPQGNSFSDDFAGYGAHVYEIQR